MNESEMKLCEKKVCHAVCVCVCIWEKKGERDETNCFII